MKIAICDDEKFFVELLQQYLLQLDLECDVFTFTNGTELLTANEPWDIVFLDIEMDPPDGFEVSKSLNALYPNTVLSFFTNHAELAIEGYDYQPFRYILKSAPTPVITRKVQETIYEFYRKNHTLQISYKGAHQTIAINRIEWIEITGHCMKIMANGEIVLWNKSLGQIEGELKKYHLIRCHRSFIVSVPQIKEIRSNQLLLRSNQPIPIGRTYRKSVEAYYRNFIHNNQE